MLQGRQSVGRNNGGFALSEVLDVFDDSMLGFRVYSAEGVVQDQDFGVLYQGPGDGYSLLLSPGNGDASFSNHCVQPLWK